MGMTSFTITLPDDMAKAVKDKVASGEYESESEVFRDSLRQFDALDMDDATLIAEIKPAYDAYFRDPDRVIPADEVFNGLAERYKARKLAQSDK